MSLDINFGQHQLISTEGARAPHLFRLRNGDVLLTFHLQGDMHFPRRKAMRSTDHGRTWRDDPPRCYKEFAWGENDNGVVLTFERDTFEVKQGQYIGRYFKSTDGGRTFDGPHETNVFVNGVDSQGYPPTEAHYPEPEHPLHRFYSPIPDWYQPLIDKASLRRGPMFWRYILEENGRWLTSMQVRFYGDTGQRSVLCESTDEGRTWRFVSVIAYEYNKLIDGNCEPVMCRAADGSLLCMMRRWGNQPLAQTRSLDDGRTWSPIELQTGLGIDPDLCLMRNGVLVCAHGRPGVNLMFSPDGSGHTWGYMRAIAEGHTSGMMSIAEVEPNKLLAVYDKRTDDHPGGGKNPDNCSIWSTTLTVERT